MRRSEKTASVFETAKMLLPDYSAFHFKGKFSSPGDEPLIALSMAINKCKPIPFQAGTICCYWEHTDEMRIDVSVPDATIMREVPESVILMHWGTRYTRGLVYQKQTAMIDILSGDGDIEKQLRRCRRSFAVKMAQDKCRTLVSRAYHKMRRIMAG